MKPHHAPAHSGRHAAAARVPKHRKTPTTVTNIREETLLVYLPIVKAVVGRMRANLPQHIEDEELHSVGLVGLISALRKYDPEQKDSFGSYAAMRIRGAILDELRRLDWMPRNARTHSKKLRATTDQLEQRLGRPAGEDEIRDELKLSPRDFQALLDEVRPISFIPLDYSPASDEPGDACLHEAVPDDSITSVRDKLEKEEMIRRVAERINKLPEIQRKVLAMYYYEDMRLSEIAVIFGLTESRICQIHAQAVQNLRTYLTRTMSN